MKEPLRKLLILAFMLSISLFPTGCEKHAISDNGLQPYAGNETGKSDGDENKIINDFDDASLNGSREGNSRDSNNGNNDSSDNDKVSQNTSNKGNYGQGIYSTIDDVLVKARRNSYDSEEIRSKLTNYRITAIKTSSNTQNLYVEMVCPQGYAVQWGSTYIEFHEYAGHNNYTLWILTKKGSLTQKNIAGYSGKVFDSWVFTWYSDSWANDYEWVGQDSIAGRNAAIYSYANARYKTWFDEQLGITLKVTDNGKVLYEVKEFQVGGVTMDSMLRFVKLDEYTIK
ncbi:MAG: hypothetical protein FWG40_07140 [Peptococcaceae bacterium]|nr:hypothetical protein [Peptococcaceae bacterium]